MVDFKRALAESRAKRLREEHNKEVDRVLKELDEEIGTEDDAIGNEKLAKLLKDVRRLLILVFK